MTISDKTRKLLWGRSGSRCAFCRGELILEAQKEDDESIVGEECHIISGKINGPRYDSTFSPDEIDAYPNLILFCRVHHKMVDDQENTFPAAFLHVLKDNHERWVREALDVSPELLSPEANQGLVRSFSKVKKLMPELISEMENDLSDSPATREFFIISKKWVMSFNSPGLVYYFEEHDDLQSKAQILENYGFIFDVTVGNAKKYRMTEEFVDLIIG